MTIRPELPGDRDNALDVELLAFHQARNSDAVEDIVEAIRAVRDEEGSFALVAERDGWIVGHVQFSRAWIGDSPLVVLGPMGVRPDYQGRGIGSELIRRGLNEAHGRGEPGSRSARKPELLSAVRLVAASTFGLRNPRVGVQPNGFMILEEHFMIVPLDERAESLVGPVRWSSAL